MSSSSSTSAVLPPLHPRKSTHARALDKFQTPSSCFSKQVTAFDRQAKCVRWLLAPTVSLVVSPHPPTFSLPSNLNTLHSTSSTALLTCITKSLQGAHACNSKEVVRMKFLSSIVSSSKDLAHTLLHSSSFHLQSFGTALNWPLPIYM